VSVTGSESWTVVNFGIRGGDPSACMLRERER
jgi:hypothetical protein